jgi:nitroreductase
MGLYEAIYARRTIRDFLNREVPSEVIERALDAGLRAPSHNHQKDWHFVLAFTQAARQAIVRAEDRGDIVGESTLKNIAKYEPLAQTMYKEAVPKQNSMILTAPVVLVMVFKPGDKLYKSETIAHMNSIAAAWCCIENILLSLAADGVFGVTMVPHNTVEIKDALGIPQELDVAAVIPFGYPAPGAVRFEQKQVAVADRVHRNAW